MKRKGETDTEVAADGVVVRAELQGGETRDYSVTWRIATSQEMQSDIREED